MGRGNDEKPRKRFSKSGHVSYRSPDVPARADVPPAASTPPPTRAFEPPAPVAPPRRDPYDDDRHRDRRYGPRYDDRHFDDRRYDVPRYDDPADSYTERLPVPPRDRRPDFDAPTYHRAPPPRRAPGYDRDHPIEHGHDPRYDDPRYDDRYDDRRHDDRYDDPRRRDPASADTVVAGVPGATAALPTAPGQTAATQTASTQTVGKAALGLGRATVSGTNRAARTVTRKVITASKSDGAEESGLTALIWNQVLSYGTDAMVTVALAGTVFFGASSNAQRGNVLLYLLVTMAPFAVVAPVIGPALDRLQHGRRWTMAGTAIGRAVLALVMAAHPTELLVLYPCALGSLVLSKAYGVVRAAAAPRLVPRGMTLTEANAKLTIFGLGSTVVLGGLVGAIIKVTGSYTAGLVVTAIGFAACGFFAFRLPKQVDSAQAAPRHPEEPVRPRRQDKVPPMARIQSWAKRGFDPHLVVALQGESVLRLLSGMFTIYLAFYVESTAHGLTAALELGGVVGAAGAGNFLGTAIGTRLKMAKPEVVIVASTAIAAAACVVGAILFSVAVACVAMLVCAITNALSKIALDSLIQHDVVETLRSSAFARSETFLQLAWVVGAVLAVAIPSTSTTDGTIALAVAAVITLFVSTVVFLRNRTTSRANPYRAGMVHPGAPRSTD